MDDEWMTNGRACEVVELDVTSMLGIGRSAGNGHPKPREPQHARHKLLCLTIRFEIDNYTTRAVRQRQPLALKAHQLVVDVATRSLYTA